MVAKLIDQIGEWNPQLLRELKGRLQPRNVAIASAISIVGQIFTFLYFQGLLPTKLSTSNRYCTATYDNGHYYEKNCVPDLNGYPMTLDHLWWLDIFVFISIIGIFALLVAGTYLLISDLSKEERQGTLNFIRLSPQSAKEIFVGKILGVPILLYLVSVLALPLHFLAGLQAHIPVTLILTFYGVLIVSCAFFYTAALVFGLISGGLGGFQAWFGSGAVLFFLFAMTSSVVWGYSHTYTPFDWLMLFYPGTILIYLADATFLPNNTVQYLNGDILSQLKWYGLSLWDKAWLGIGFIVLHYGLWTHGLSKILKRRFHNPLKTVLSKAQSYWLTGSFIVIVVGFTLQKREYNSLFDNFGILTAFIVIFFLGLMFAISPQRQALQDWARYRHQDFDRKNIIRDLIFAEKSPSLLAVALNLGIIVTFLAPVIVLSPLGKDTGAALAGLFLGVNMILIYAAIGQLVLLLKTPKRTLAAASMVGTFILLPLMCFVVLNISPSEEPFLWFFSFLPIVATQNASAMTVGLAILGQWLALSLISLQMTRQLRLAGKSEAKALLSSV